MDSNPEERGNPRRTALLIAAIAVVGCCSLAALALVVLGPVVGQIFSRGGP